MRATFHILICCLYVLSAVDANPFSKSGSAEVQQGNAKAASPLKFWSDDKSGDDGKDANDDKDNKDDNDYCASRSVAVLIGTSTYAIPCLQGDSIVNLNGLVPTSISSITSSSATETSSSAVSSSAPPSSSAASSSEASSTTDSITSTNSTTTTTDSTTTTTDTTTSADSSPTFTVTLYLSNDCTEGPFFTSSNSGCFNLDFLLFGSAATTSTAQLKVDSFLFPNCVGIPTFSTQISSGACAQDLFIAGFTSSYSVTIV